MNFPSKLVESAVEEISKLPGIGKKTALRLALFLLKEDEQVTNKLSSALVKLRTEIKYCKQCFNISDEDTCSICSSPRRDNSLVCVVENSADLLAIENTSQFNGTYHVLGGVISPIDGIGPSELRLGELIDRCSSGEVKEIILAFSATMEADTTAFYITKKMKGTKVRISTIARGVPIGSEIEYTDEVTLGRSILKRIAYE